MNEDEAIRISAKKAGIRNPTEAQQIWLKTLHHWIKDHNPIYKVYEQTNNFAASDGNLSLIFTKNVPLNTDGDPRTFTDPNEVSGPVRLNDDIGAIIDTTHEGSEKKY